MPWKIGGKLFRRTDVKITLWYIFTFLLSSLMICGFLYLRLKNQLVKEIDQFLLDEIKEMERVLSQEVRETYFLIRFEDEVMVRKYYPFFFQILDKEGKPVYVSNEFRELDYTLDDGVLTNAKNGKETREQFHSAKRGTSYRIISIPIYKNGTLTGIIQMGTHLFFVIKNLVRFRNNILFALPVVMMFGALGGWMLARKSLSPIGYIVSKSRSITSEKLSERLNLKGAGDEMDDLIQTINDMIARLESSFKRMAEFTEDVSHELKTPICAMRGEAEVLISKKRKAEEYQEGLAHFIEQFDHLNQMINNLILLSNSDATRVEFNLAPLRLDLLIRELCHLFQILAEQSKIVLEIGVVDEIVVSGDKTRLQQLFTNLIDNAIKYTPEGFIHVTTQKIGDSALVKIKDTGVGISKEDQEKIFKRFYRVDKSRSRESGGVGLGLSIADWIARAHHGRIEVESQLNKGSTFKVYLPIQKT